MAGKTSDCIEQGAPDKPLTHRGSRNGMSKAPSVSVAKQKHAARALGEQEQHSWTYDDLAEFTGKTRMAIHQAAHRGSFDPEDLGSVILYAIRNAKYETKLDIFFAFYPRPTGRRAKEE